MLQSKFKEDAVQWRDALGSHKHQYKYTSMRDDYLQTLSFVLFDDSILCALGYSPPIKINSHYLLSLQQGRRSWEATVCGVTLCGTALRHCSATHVHYVHLFQFSLLFSLSPLIFNSCFLSLFGAVEKEGGCNIPLMHTHMHRQTSRHIYCFINQ